MYTSNIITKELKKYRLNSQEVYPDYLSNIELFVFIELLLFLLLLTKLVFL